eukprot:scaffold28103_cov66-Phaeocystis_antarctica.AAC.2
MALTSHGGHLGWCERADPWASTGRSRATGRPQPLPRVFELAASKAVNFTAFDQQVGGALVDGARRLRFSGGAHPNSNPNPGPNPAPDPSPSPSPTVALTLTLTLKGGVGHRADGGVRAARLRAL